MQYNIIQYNTIQYNTVQQQNTIPSATNVNCPTRSLVLSSFANLGAMMKQEHVTHL